MERENEMKQKANIFDRIKKKKKKVYFRFNLFGLLLRLRFFFPFAWSNDFVFFFEFFLPPAALSCALVAMGFAVSFGTILVYKS